MPSAFTHVAPALALLPVFARGDTKLRLLVAGAFCAVAPDLDVAAILAAGVALLVARRNWPRAWLYLFLVTASHGLLGAFTDGGLGIALLSPFDTTRYFFPLRPIEVLPLSARAFFTARGWAILASELLWVWLPCTLLGATLFAVTQRRTRSGRFRAIQ